jgi:hypothetical protein
LAPGEHWPARQAYGCRFYCIVRALGNWATLSALVVNSRSRRDG